MVDPESGFQTHRLEQLVNKEDVCITIGDGLTSACLHQESEKRLQVQAVTPKMALFDNRLSLTVLV